MPVAALASLPPELEPLLVGGALRDRLLGRPVKDFDGVVAGEGERAADLIAERLGQRWFRLGGERFAAFRFEGPDFRLDLFDRAPMSLRDDLERRDLTINSMALDLVSGDLIDPFEGLADLQARRLRATSDRAFEDDPLRLLRLVRIASQLDDFEVDRATIELAARSAPTLDTVAAERIRTELREAFARPAASYALLREFELYPSLWSASPDTTARDLSSRISTLERRIGSIERSGAAVDRFLVSQATLFEQLGEGAIEQMRLRRHLTNRDARNVERLRRSAHWPADDPGRRWFLHRAGELWPSAVAYAGSRLDDARWNDEHLALLDLARNDSEAVFTPAPLLDGHEISELLQLPPGPELGEAVLRLRRAQVEARVVDREAAIRWCRSYEPSADGGDGR